MYSDKDNIPMVLYSFFWFQDYDVCEWAMFMTEMLVTLSAGLVCLLWSDKSRYQFKTHMCFQYDMFIYTAEIFFSTSRFSQFWSGFFF